MTMQIFTTESIQQRLAEYHSSKEYDALVATYDLAIPGVWRAKTGEDAMSGTQSQHLGYFSGTLGDVINHLVLLCPTFRGFHTWGDIEAINPIGTNKQVLDEQIKLRVRKNFLDQELKILNSQIL